MAIKRRGSQEVSATVGLLAVGEYEARLAYVADLGIIEGQEYKGETKPDCQQLCLGLEILGHTVTIDGVDKPQVLWAEPFNLFSTLDVRGREFKQYKAFCTNAEPGDVSEWEQFLGSPCNVTIKHSKDGKYANIAELNPIPLKYQADVEDMKTEDSCTGDVDDEDNPAQANMYGLPRWLVDNKRVTEPSDNGEEVVEVEEESTEEGLPF